MSKKNAGDQLSRVEVDKSVKAEAETPAPRRQLILRSAPPQPKKEINFDPYGLNDLAAKYPLADGQLIFTPPGSEGWEQTGTDDKGQGIFFVPKKKQIVQLTEVSVESSGGKVCRRSLYLPVAEIDKNQNVRKLVRLDDFVKQPNAHEVAWNRSYKLMNAHERNDEAKFPKALFYSIVNQHHIPNPAAVWRLKRGETPSADDPRKSWQWDGCSPIDATLMVVLWWTSHRVPFAGFLGHFKSSRKQLTVTIIDTSNMALLPLIGYVTGSWPEGLKINPPQPLRPKLTYAVDRMPHFYKVPISKRLNAAGIEPNEFVFPNK